ncbi:unnamed protein product [Albugo candida]|uniref:FCP1 homology domain-containing protein n=1 Tax=Albugo candida TaxID=65357 RepID=A0A024G648_9STRA|nr:unnamed protein product [Albugo candida]|eukprot:CCI42018.1 unnamed protein product [Albugo candida]
MVLKCLLSGLLPVLCSGGFHKNSFFDAIKNPALQCFFEEIFEKLDKRDDYCVFFELDNTILRDSFPNTVLAKQIVDGEFYFQAADVPLVFGFYNHMTGNLNPPFQCIGKDENFSAIVKKIQDIFAKRDRRLNFRFEEGEKLRLKELIPKWLKMASHVVQGDKEECAYLSITVPYRLLYNMNNEERTRLFQRAFSPSGEGEEVNDLPNQAVASPKMLQLIHALSEGKAKTYIISAMHSAYLESVTDALRIENSITGVFGTTCDNEIAGNAFKGVGNAMVRENKASKIKEIIKGTKCQPLLVADDPQYDRHMLVAALENGAHALAIFSGRGDKEIKKWLKTFGKTYDLRKVIGTSWIE